MKLGAKVCAPYNRLSQLQNLTSICKHLPGAAAAAAPIQIGGGTFSSSPGGKAALCCSHRVVSLSLICCRSYAKIFAMKKFLIYASMLLNTVNVDQAGVLQWSSRRSFYFPELPHSIRPDSSLLFMHFEFVKSPLHVEL